MIIANCPLKMRFSAVTKYSTFFPSIKKIDLG